MSIFPFDPPVDPVALQMMQALPQAPMIPSGQEIYDALMGRIEPELTTSQAPLLKEKYVNETPEEKAQRAERYAHAFQAYEIAFRALMQELEASVRTFQRTVQGSVELRSREEENAAIADLDSQIFSA